MKVFFTILLVLFLPYMTFGATIYVDADCTGNPETDYHPGNDACSGGSSTVYSTIAGAESAMSGGDIISIRAGSYNERPTISEAGSDGSPTTFQSYNSEAVDVNGFVISANWVKIYDLTVDWDGTNSGSGAVSINGNSDITLDTVILTDANNLMIVNWTADGNRLTVENCTFYDFGTAIKLAEGDNHIIRNNTFHTPQPATYIGNGDGIFLQSSQNGPIANILIKGNLFYGWTQQGGSEHTDGIQFVTASSECSTSQCSGAIVEYNYFDFREDGAQPGDQISCVMLDGNYRGAIFRYNIFKGNKGINAGGQAIQDVEVYNNTFIGDLSFDSALNSGGMAASASHSSWYVHNNISVDNMDRSLYLSGSGHSTGNNYEYTTDSSNPSNSGVTVTVADPKFVNYVAAGSAPGDYSLDSGSPCINSGSTVTGTGNYDDGLDPAAQYANWPAPSTIDQDSYSNWEIGAYVYRTGQSPTITGLNCSGCSWRY